MYPCFFKGKNHELQEHYKTESMNSVLLLPFLDGGGERCSFGRYIMSSRVWILFNFTLQLSKVIFMDILSRTVIHLIRLHKNEVVDRLFTHLLIAGLLNQSRLLGVLFELCTSIFFT